MEPAVLRDDMVASLEHEMKGLVRSDNVGLALRTVPRHEFVPIDAEQGAYADQSFDHRGTRILAPSIVARLLEALDVREDDSVLVVGAGVGYTSAVLAEIVGERNVHAIDITRTIVYEARENLESAGYGGVFVDCGDGADGLPEYAPFDRILVEAAAIEPPRTLVSQLADDGRLVIPLGSGIQRLAAVEPSDSDSGSPETVEEFGKTAFAPLLVEGEQSDTIERNRTNREDREFAERHAQTRRGWEHEWIDWDGY
ncbi:protein-L-isoaspartate(D-aspartate) O-methyltransferase [Haladaptatus litoreus]|uniref:protein-L-isoaspartate(D-aspartate) O-methyltransferase n=1 Tax=Haladaptatus litoreus TaxID=553468 RepID=A0A1N6VAG4_9EURY|nr:protein-L-isoaspartate O-methyltransferase [Haladaptatus litoreus]SIQ74835.1 protein-L-isoaspartate(D-aspartate) O-methyltransferase [Haladaptatus litoreus]